MAKRVHWKCPSCQRESTIPAGNTPALCPSCNSFTSVAGPPGSQHGRGKVSKLAQCLTIRALVLMLGSVILSCSMQPSDPGPQPEAEAKNPLLGMEQQEVEAKKALPGIRQPAVIDDIQVEILDTDYITAIPRSGEDVRFGQLGLHIRVTNVSKTRLVSFLSWTSREFGLVSREKVSIQDEHGNEYSASLIRHDFLDGIYSGHIHPGKSEEGWIATAAAVDAAKRLRIRLPAVAVGLKGAFQFEIPAPPKPKEEKPDEPFDQLLNGK